MAEKWKFNGTKKQSLFDIIESNGVSPFPLDVFPEQIKNVINEVDKVAGFEPQVVGSSILFSVSTIIGLSRKIIVKRNIWEDTPNLWIAIVGKRGTMKTPSINYAIKPLVNAEKTYATEFEFAMSEYLKIPKKDRDENNKPRRRQRFTSDTTIEGLIDAMQYNHNGMGMFKDELNGFFKEMNRYNSGGDLEFYLSAFSGGYYSKNRKSYDPQSLNDVYLSILGGVQPEVLKQISNTQVSNGMIDRWLYVISSDTVPDTQDNEMTDKYTSIYHNFMNNIINECSYERGLEWNDDARELFFLTINEIESMMKEDSCEPMLFTYLSKLKTYMARFVIIMAIMDNSSIILLSHIEKARQLVIYFISTAMEIFIGFENNQTVHEIFKLENATTKKQRILAIKKHFPEASNTKIAELSGTSRPYANDVINNKK